MADKKLSIYPRDEDRLIVGGNTPACNRAVSCWAMVLRQNMPELDRAEWNMIADVLNGTYDGDYALGLYQHGASALALELHDAQRLNGTGDKWLGDPAEPGSGQAACDELLAKIERMRWEQIQYIRTAVNFFWEGARPDRHKIDHRTDEWWTLRYRLDYFRAMAAEPEQ